MVWYHKVYFRTSAESNKNNVKLHSKPLLKWRPFSDFYIAPAMSVIGWLTIYLMYVCMYVDQTFLTNFRALYLTEFLTDFGQIFVCDSTSYTSQCLSAHTLRLQPPTRSAYVYITTTRSAYMSQTSFKASVFCIYYQ